VWHTPLSGESAELEDLRTSFEALARKCAGALVEKKSLSIAFHYRRVSRRLALAIRVEAESLAEEWLRTHPGYECIRGAEVVEVRPTGARKSVAVPWLRERAGPEARIVALGDDLTDEDMFAALGASDEGILVTAARDRPTAARWVLEGPEEVSRFLGWLDAARRGPVPDPTVLPRPLPPLTPGDLLVISDAGAYGYAMSSNYNSIGRAPQLWLEEDGSVTQISRRETVEDILKAETDERLV
jgi:hypothetical protein